MGKHGRIRGQRLPLCTVYDEYKKCYLPSWPGSLECWYHLNNEGFPEMGPPIRGKAGGRRNRRRIQAKGKLIGRLLDKQGGVCPLCLRDIEDKHNIAVDHMHAWIHGGTNDESNLAVVHKKCNQAKSSYLICDPALDAALNGVKLPHSNTRRSIEEMHGVPLPGPRKFSSNSNPSARRYAMLRGVTRHRAHRLFMEGMCMLKDSEVLMRHEFGQPVWFIASVMELPLSEVRRVIDGQTFGLR